MKDGKVLSSAAEKREAEAIPLFLFPYLLLTAKTKPALPPSFSSEAIPLVLLKPICEEGEALPATTNSIAAADISLVNISNTSSKTDLFTHMRDDEVRTPFSSTKTYIKESFGWQLSKAKSTVVLKVI